MARVAFADLVIAVSRTDLKIRKCGSHVQILGGAAVVNFYNGNNGTTIYIQGTAKGRKVSTASEVIAAALGNVSGSEKAERKRNYRSMKRRKWKTEERKTGRVQCHWCGRQFVSFAETTADHVIPLSKGGSNGYDNIVLACNPCNTARSNNVDAAELMTVNKQK